MKDDNDAKERPQSMVELYYKRVVKVAEYYIFICFIIITVVPLLEYSWVPGFIKFVYFTGFPLLIILLLVSLVRDAVIGALKRRFESQRDEAKATQGKGKDG